MIRIPLKPFLFCLLVCLYACGQARQTEIGRTKATSETLLRVSSNEAFSDIALDSAQVENFINLRQLETKRASRLRQFYRSRDYQFAWFNADGFAQQARMFWNLHNQYVNLTKDSSFFDRKLHREMKALTEADEWNTSKVDVTELELMLTDHFFDYARYAYTGRIDPDELQWHIPRKKINVIALLDSLVSRNGQRLDEWEPVNQQYKFARKALLHLHAIQKQGGWAVIETDKVLREGDSARAIVQLKQRLFLPGDYPLNDGTSVFTSDLTTAVQQVQRRFGLKADGVVGPKTLKALNLPVEKRIEQLLVNMERMRWMPAYKKGVRLVANIPEYKLHVFNDRKEAFQMRIVVGKAANKTVVFNDQLKYIVFSPYWNIPQSIVRRELLPAMQRDPGYLTNHNMEQTGNRNGLPVIRQRPGGSNALGRVKFLFPNSYNIYFHDTPAKSLFERQQRAFSHGCIRLAEPVKLARFLLKDKSGWTDDKIRASMYGDKETWVTLSKPVSVEITYFTAWVDNEGLLNFREDIYGHDEALAEQLFTE